MTERRAWTWCAVAGVLAFAASLLFGQIPGLKPCGPAPHGLGAILAVEFVRSPAEVAALFGAEPCRSALIAAQRTGLLLDGLWFIPAYTMFLTMAAMALDKHARLLLTLIAVAAGLSDEIEGVLLWSMLNALPGSADQIAGLFWAVHIKFMLLAFATAFIGLGLMVSDRPWPVKTIGVAICVGGVLAGSALGDERIAAMMRWFAIAWTALLVVAVAGAVRPSALAARGGPRPTPVPPAA